MHGIEGFADIIKKNSSTILDSLTSQDKQKLYGLLPEVDTQSTGKSMSRNEQKEAMLRDLLTNQMPKQFNMTPLENFGAKL